MVLPDNLWLTAAAGVTLCIALLHVLAGGLEHHRPMLRSAIREEDKGVWFVLWHFVTAALILMATSLLGAAHGQPALALLPFGLSIYFTALFLFETWRRFRNPFALPQWALFGALSGLIGAGLLCCSA